MRRGLQGGDVARQRSQMVLDHLERGDRHTELLALLGVADRQLQHFGGGGHFDDPHRGRPRQQDVGGVLGHPPATRPHGRLVKHHGIAALAAEIAAGRDVPVGPGHQRHGIGAVHVDTGEHERGVLGPRNGNSGAGHDKVLTRDTGRHRRRKGGWPR